MLIGGMTICKGKTNNHVRILSDKKQHFFNISYMINKGQSKSESCSKIAKKAMNLVCTSKDLDFCGTSPRNTKHRRKWVF